MDELMHKIEIAEELQNAAEDFAAAVFALSNSRYKITVVHLLHEIQTAIAASESAWQQIERRADFKENFHDRESARLAYMKNIAASE